MLTSLRRRVLLSCAVLVLALAPVAGDTSPEDLYVRTQTTVRGTAEAVLRWARERKASVVVVAFDVLSFAPPRAWHELRPGPQFARDLDAWTAALGAASKAGDSGAGVYLATTGGTDLAPANDGRAAARLAGGLRDTNWTAKTSPVAPNFADWAARTLAAAPAGRRALVLVTGLVLPENLADGLLGPGPPEPWRRHLARSGTYWDEERVIAALARSEASFAVVAPEARFCDYLPTDDLPEVPWASRPVVRGRVVDAGDEPIDDPDADWRALEETQRKRMEAEGLSDEEIERALQRLKEEFAERRAHAPPEPGDRFDAATPRFCDWAGSRVLLNTDCPSGFGYWPFARVAAAADGRYFVYPASGRPWLDACPRDEALMAALAPSLATRRAWSAARARDPALADMLAIVARAKDDPPWPPDRGPLGEGVWCAFESAGGGASPDDRWRERDLPCEAFPLVEAAKHDWEKEAERARAAAERHAAAADGLGRLAERLARRAADRADPRTEANVLLTRFWLEMSAFHLDALALCFEDVPRMPGLRRGGGDRVVTAYTSAIRLSDCLDAYDGRRISAEEERELRSPNDAVRRWGAQSNFLATAIGDPRYRARRTFDAVTANLDPRLLPRARRMVAAAQAVMDRYARTPWGWVVYYAEADTFVHESQPSGVGAIDTGPLPAPPDDGPSTPRSDPGGPRSPR